MRVEYEGGPNNAGWSVRWRDLLLHIRLHNGTLLADYFGPAAHGTLPTLPGAEVFDALTVTRGDTAVHLAPDSRQVLWTLHDWTQPDPASLALNLQAAEWPLQAGLRFVVDEQTGILLRTTNLLHTGDGPALSITHAGIMAVLLPPDVREIVQMGGRWGAEAQAQRFTLPQTALLMESRSGKTGFEFLPHIALLSPTHTYITQLCWSGNWQYYIRRNATGQVLVSGGLNSWGLRQRLVAGDAMSLPDMLLGCVEGDLNAAARQLHRYQRRLRPDPERPVPVQFNSWFPYQGEPPVSVMKAYAARTAELGCEIFVLDAGWYTTEHEEPGEDWWTRTGDWVVNRTLFPEGLEELARYCRELGIDFGIWMEPESVGPNARIRTTHPEWLHVVGGRATPPDSRGILNLGVPAAREWIRERILSVLRTTGARWLKWDFNIDLLQGGWAQGLPEALTRQDPILAHYQALYRLQDELREAVPDMILEMCSSGGSRLDAAILAHSHVYWLSDQTHPLMKLAIHFGSQQAHPPEQCNDWLVEWPPHEAQHDPLRAPGGEEGDLAFRTRVAMLGSFGISAPVEKWSSRDIAIVKEHVAWYKQIARPVIQAGDQYLLTEAPPLNGNGDWAAVWYVLPDGARGILFAFRLENGPSRQAFALPGLDPTALYRITSLEGRISATAIGANLAAGIAVEAEAPFRSVLLSIELVQPG